MSGSVPAGIEEVDAAFLATRPLPAIDATGDKDTRGRVLVIAGAVSVPGAALLAGIAGLRAGAGKLQIATVRSIAPHLGLAVPEAMVIGLPETEEGGVAASAASILRDFVNRADAVLIGPGMVDRVALEAFIPEAICSVDGPTLVLDAGALEAFAVCRERMPHCTDRLIVTPHAGEAARMLGLKRDEIGADAVRHAVAGARKFAGIFVLKGPQTIVATPEGAAYCYRQGSIGLATSGSGDTLAGIVAGLAARGASPLDAALWGVYLHGAAGRALSRRRGPIGFLAREILDEIPGLMREGATE